MIGQILGTVFGPLLNFGKTVVGNMQKRKQAKDNHQFKMLELKLKSKEVRAEKKLNALIELDKINTESMASSWKDEYVLFIFSIPVIMCFIPGLAPFALAGFGALAKCPLWFQTIFVVMCLTIYGHRKLAKLFAARFLGLKKGDLDEDKGTCKCDCQGRDD